MAKRVFKTKRALSGIRTEYRAWKDWDEGDILVGKLVGTSKNRKNKSKNDWIVEVLEVMFADRKAAKKLKPGTKLTLNTAGQFDKGMEELEIGGLFQVTYNGSVEMKGGEYEGQMAHTMEVVEVTEGDDDDGDDIDEDEDEDSDDDDDSDDYDEDEDEEDDL